MNIGEFIDVMKVGQRDFDPQELANAMRKGAFWTLASWGAKDFAKHKDLWLRFRVSGLKFKGLVYITLAWNDTFTLYFVSSRGTIKEKMEEVYIDELIRRIDKFVETN